MKFLFSILFFLTAFASFGQLSNLRSKKVKQNQIFTLDSLTVYQKSIQVFCGNLTIPQTEYNFNQNENSLLIPSNCSDSFTVFYRVFEINFKKKYFNYDTSLLYTHSKGDREKFKIQGVNIYEDVFGTSGITKSGSISRGISFGNNQDLSINSTLNLELKGDLAPNLKILATVTDDNLPIQPEGNTNKIQEFDQVFIQLYNDNFKLIAGDFWINRPKGYFLNYKKRAQGLYGDYTWKNRQNGIWKIQGSGALSKGKFARQIIQGVEGNQGPYRLQGNENEPFIIILSGTERVYIDGKLLDRGQEFDYTINYNTAEVTFTAKNFITKDIRIVVEFQYSDLNYARSLVQANVNYTSSRFDFWLNTYSEQDAKNQTIQQDLTITDKQKLSAIGDSLFLARVSSIDSIGFLENQNLYKMIDSLGIDSVLVFSVNKDSAFFRASFSYVGYQKGNYVLAQNNALGKVFKWVAPINGIPQGDYETARLIVTPKQKQFVSSGFTYKISEKTSIETEFAYSKNDLNTFSRFDSKDDVGWSNRTKLFSEKKIIKRDTIYLWTRKSSIELEYLNKNFSPIEQYRSVEFDRDWNTRSKNYQGQQLSTNASTSFEHIKNGLIGLELNQYAIGDEYSGYKSRLFGKWTHKGFFAQVNGSYLSSFSETKNDYLRHKITLSQKIRKIKLSYKDDFEQNYFKQASVLNPSSYLFYDKEFAISNSDSSFINYSIFYRERLDKRSDSTRLLNAAKARTSGFNISLNNDKINKLNLILNYRELSILNSNLINSNPENNLLGRIDYDQNINKGLINWNTFYEIGSGLELKKEFLYVQVNDGQGVYTWIDYNGNGIKELNEFEVAQFVDQASYIRVFTPSSEYVKTFSTEFNQGVFIKPEKIWTNKTGFRNFVGRFSNQSKIRISKKTNSFNSREVLNPFQGNISDTVLISSNSTIRNNLYFNRTNNIFGCDYVYQSTQAKNLLASGFDARNQLFHELNARINIKRKFSIESTFQQGKKEVEADYTSGRNYSINYILFKPTFIYQPTTSFRLALNSRYSNKKDISLVESTVNEIGFQLKYNQTQKGSFQSAFSVINIVYNGDQNSALGFEMLESLKPGQNFTWSMSYQRAVSKNLQLSIQYNGRKSEGNKFIHSGGMEVRAFF